MRAGTSVPSDLAGAWAGLPAHIKAAIRALASTGDETRP